MGVANFNFYLIFSLFLMFIQYMIAPKVVEWSMGVRYVSPSQAPGLHRMVEELARKAGIPKPRVGISPAGLPNAFAFGRWRHDGRICVTEGIMNLLQEGELRAVLGHEISHLKNRDVLTITLLSVIPIVLYRIAWGMLFFRGWGRRRDEGAYTAIIGILAFLFYFITNLLVLYASRIREYFADKGSVDLGNPPRKLATALYKLVYGSARLPRESLRQTEGIKAFFLNDPTRAVNEFSELKDLDTDASGTIDRKELEEIRSRPIKLTFADKLMEILSTHPNMLKRIKMLASYETTSTR
jgi:heat shock protein HtpX